MTFPHSVTVQSVTHAKDASGGTVDTFATRQAGVRCLITQQSGDATDAFGAATRTQRHTVTTTYAGVRRGDRLLVVAGPPNLAGQYLRVSGITFHGGAVTIPAFCRLTCDQVLA